VLLDDALALDHLERARLAHDLIASLDGPPEADTVSAWDLEIVRRIDEVNEGRADLRDASEVIGEIRKRIS
jgi:hypothetical protein